MALRVHHVNCGTLCPRVLGEMVCHSLLVETARDGLVLVDGGMGTLGLRDPARFGRLYLALTRPKADPSETALAHVARLGFAPRDVRHVIVTHLDLDHAGALADFPKATVHVHAAELDAARARATAAEKRRYLPDEWAHEVRWQAYQAAGEPWHGFAAVRALRGLPEELLLVPLPGHTRGHAGVAVHGERGWLLHAGDAYFHRDEIHGARRAPWGVRAFQRLNDMDTHARVANQARLRALAGGDAGVRVFSAHDAMELASAQA